MKVLIADKLEKSGLEGLAAAGCEVMYRPELKDDTLVEAVGDTAAEVLVVRSTRVTESVLDAGRLRLIVRAGAGVNTIDVAGATRRGIHVSNCPGKNSVAVAELAFGLLLALDRRIPDNVADLRAGRWNKKEYSVAQGLYGRTLGLLGIGSIGREMTRRATAFGMHVVIWSRRYAGQDRPLEAPEVDSLGLGSSDLRTSIALAPTPAAVAARSDALSIHLALSTDTTGLVNTEVLGKLRPGALLINTARAEIVDQAALADAVRERGLRVGLDVFAREPASATGDFEDPIVRLPGVYGTHHIGASTDQAQEAIAAETVRIISTFTRTGEVPNLVNPHA
jgi:D-3-phosphoglycerate dehydrogenase